MDSKVLVIIGTLLTISQIGILAVIVGRAPPEPVVTQAPGRWAECKQAAREGFEVLSHDYSSAELWKVAFDCLQGPTDISLSGSLDVRR